MIHVSIIEANDVFREGLTAIFNSAPGFHCASSYSDIATAHAVYPFQCPDAVLLDLDLPDAMNGIQLLKHSFQGLRIVILADRDQEDRVFNALRSGADGYVGKNTEPLYLIRTIRNYYRGRLSVDPDIAGRMLAFFKGDNTPPLSPSEKQILEALSNRQSLSAIAADLGVSPESLYIQLNHIQKKLTTDHTRLSSVEQSRP